jgi:transposase
MSAHPHPPLPDDIAQCHRIIADLQSHNTDLQAHVTDLQAHATDLQAHATELAATLEEQQRRALRLQVQVELLLKRLYGPRAERIDPAQLVMFGQETAAAPEPEEAAELEQAHAPKPIAKGHGRKPLPEDLPRKRLVHDVPEAEKTCPECAAPKRCIGEDIREQIEYVPASLFVLEHVYPKYACPCCQEHVSAAKAAPRVIDKGLPGPGLVAHIVTSKYCDHLPLYRQEFMLARHGVELSRKTLCGWILTVADKLQPLLDTMRGEVLASRVIHTDDTPVRVQGNGKDGPFTGRFWVYVGDGAHPYTVYDYTPTRRRDGPAAFLDGYTGYLQADAFGGYDGIYASGDVIEVACWAHARRKFHEARSTDSNRAHRMLAWIRQLYDIERDGKKLDAEQRHALREEKSKPLFEGSKDSEGRDIQGIKDWLIEQHAAVLPKSPIGDAIGYALNHWTALTRYLDDGDLDIDNNEAEQALRGIAIGRKNWMFLGSDRGGRAAATYYTLIQSAKRHGLDPFAYLRDILLRTTTEPNTGLHQLLPDRWKASLQS